MKCLSSQSVIIQEKSHRPFAASACLGFSWAGVNMACPERLTFFRDGCFLPFSQPFTSTALAFITFKSASFSETSIRAHFRGHDLPLIFIALDTCMACSSHTLRNAIGEGVLMIAVM